MYKAKLTTFGKDREEHRVWQILSNDPDRVLNKTAVISYSRRKDRARVSFIIDHEKDFAVIIDNGEWDLLAFDLEYDENDTMVACQHFLDFIKENHKVIRLQEFEFDDYDNMMQYVS
jgi:hypothetical protein